MPESILAEAHKDFDSALSHLHEENGGLRVGRANPSMVESIQVDQYGQLTVVKNVANITVPEPTQLLISPWDAGMCNEIEKAISDSSLGLTTQNDGKSVRVMVPPMTEDRRKEVAKMADEHGEQAKIRVRTIREEARKKFDRKGEDEGLSEDVITEYKNKLQEKVDAVNKEIDTIVKGKREEIMTV